MFQFDPSAGPWAATVNKQIESDQNAEAIYGDGYTISGFWASYQGDPLVGSYIPNTSIAWVDSTECQGLIYNWYVANNMAIPSNMQDILTTNAGPAFGPGQWWNGSYANFGFVPGNPGQVTTAKVFVAAQNKVLTGTLLTS